MELSIQTRYINEHPAPPAGILPSITELIAAMMDVALLKLITAGLTALCQPDGGATPGSISTDDRMRDLARAAPAATNHLVTRTVEDIWQSCRAVGLPPEFAEPHLVALSEMIAATGLTDDERHRFDPAAPQPDQHELRRIAARIVTDARSRGTSPDGVDDTVLDYLLGAFLTSLASSRTVLRELTSVPSPPIIPELAAAGPALPPISEIDETTAAETPEATTPIQTEPVLSNDAETSSQAPSRASATLAKIERAEALGVTVPVLEQITVSLINQTRSADIRHDDLVASAEAARDLETRLTELGPILAQSRQLDAALNRFRGGRFSECDSALAAIEDNIVKSSTNPVSRPISDHPELDIRVIRADLQGLRGAWTKAARFYGRAQRYLPRGEHALRWRIAEREAHYYELAAFHLRRSSELDHTARAVTGALSAIPLEGNPRLRADIQRALARSLLILGERDEDRERFELAAQLLANAAQINALEVDVSRADASVPDIAAATAPSSAHTDARTELTMMRAHALTRLGEMTLDADLIEQAISLYQTLLTDRVAAHELLPAGLMTAVAIAAAALPAVSGSATWYSTAIETIEQTLPEIAAHRPAYRQSGIEAVILAARCHLTLAAVATARGAGGVATAHRAKAAEAFSMVGFAERAARVIAAAEPPAPAVHIPPPVSTETIA